MRDDAVVTEVGQRYDAAYAAHYGRKNLGEALTLYKALLAAHPDTREAGYARSQIQNIVKAVVSQQTLSDVQADLAAAQLQSGDVPDVRPVPVAVPAQRWVPEPSSAGVARPAGTARGLVLLLCLSLMPAVVTAQADATEIPTNAHVGRYGVGWECDWGYQRTDQSCAPLTVPAHAHLNNFGVGWECDRGYRDVQEVCVPVLVPLHAFLRASGHAWECDRGYQRRAESCAPVVVPADAHLDASGAGWACERGFRRGGLSCVALVIPRYAHIGYSDNAWICNPGYRQHGDTCRPDAP